MFECRRAKLGATTRMAAPRPHSKARLVVAGPGGRVVWSAGKSTIALWGAYDGDYFGTLTPGSDSTVLEQVRQPASQPARGVRRLGVVAHEHHRHRSQR